MNESELKKNGYILFYAGNEKNQNKVGILVDDVLEENVVDIKAVGNRIIPIWLIFGEEVIKMISFYASEV